MTHYGMPALIELDTVEQHCALCAELGLSFVELNTNFPNQQLHQMDTAVLHTLAKKCGIFYTLHLNDEMPVADFNPTVAKGYCDAVVEAIQFGKQVGAKLLNMHISEGARYTQPDRRIYFYEAYQADYLKRIVHFRDICTEAVGSSELRICIENSKAYFDFQKAAIDLLLESPVFALTLDIGHSHCSNYADEPWIFARKNRLIHMHIHDACNGQQDHLPLGKGELDIPEYLALAKDCSRSAVLEVKTLEGLRHSVDWLQANNYL